MVGRLKRYWRSLAKPRIVAKTGMFAGSRSIVNCLMTSPIDGLSLFLFVPADRPERFEKAMAAGADAVIIDLEDAVAPTAKVAARQMLVASLKGASPCPVFIRVNAIGTEWHDGDLAAVASLDATGVLLPKAESANGIEVVRRTLDGKAVVAIIESAAGLAIVEDISTAADRLAFGSIDFAADLGCAHSRDALLLARSRIVLAARLASKPAPIDGVTQAIRDEAEIEGDARYGVSLGFGGKLLIHPAQIVPARRGMAPTERDVEWAMKVVDISPDGAAVAVDGGMVDAPVLARARQIIAAHHRYANG
jgi:citrate lyase subunit beta/citryl-CoA lyase